MQQNQQQQQQMMQQQQQHGGGGGGMMQAMDIQHQQQQQNQQSQQHQQQQQQQPQQQQQFPPGTFVVTDQHGGPPRMMRSVQMQAMQGGRMVMMQGPPGQPAHIVQMQAGPGQQQQMMQQQQGRPMMTMGPGPGPGPGGPSQGTPQQMQQQQAGPGGPVPGGGGGIIRPSMNEMEFRRMLQMMKPESRDHLLKLPEDQRKTWIQKMMKEAQARTRPGGPAQMQQQFMGGGVSADGSVMTQHHVTGGPPGSAPSMVDSQFAAQTVVATGPAGGSMGPGPGGYPGQAQQQQQQQQQQFMQNQQHQFMQQKGGPMMGGPPQGPSPQQQQAMLQQQQHVTSGGGGQPQQQQQIMYRVMEQPQPMRPGQFSGGGGGPRSLPHSGVQIVQQPVMQQQMGGPVQAFGQFGGSGPAAGVMGGPGPAGGGGGPPHGLSPGNFASMGGGPAGGGGPGSMAPYASPQGVGGPMSSSGPSPGSSAYMQDASPGYPTAMHMNMQSKMMGVMEPSPLSAMAASANMESSSSQQQQQQQMMGGGGGGHGQSGTVGGPPSIGGGHNSAAVVTGSGGGGGGPMPLNPMDEMRYQEKIRELQVYLDFLKRSLEQQQREGVNPVQNKLQKFINILEGRDRVSYEILLKCEESFKRNKQMQEEGVDNRSRIFQPFLDSIVTALSKSDKRDAVNMIFKRTFDFPWSNIPESKRIRPAQMHEEMMKTFNESSSNSDIIIKKDEPPQTKPIKKPYSAASMTSSPASRDHTSATDQSEDAADVDNMKLSSRGGQLRRSSLVDVGSVAKQQQMNQQQQQQSRDQQQKRRSSLVDNFHKKFARDPSSCRRSRLVDSSSDNNDDVIGKQQQQQPIIAVPLAIQREVACLEPRFKITLDKSRDHSSVTTTSCNSKSIQQNNGSSPTNQDEQQQQKVVCLLCDIKDADLPLVPALKLKVPLDYPLNNPKFDLSFDDFGSVSFFDRIKKQADGKFARMGSNYSITAILNNWESTIRQVCAM